MNRKINIVLANAPIANGNLGCVALSYTSMYLVDCVMRESNIAYRLYLTDAQNKKSGEYFIEINDRKIPYTQISHFKSIDLKDLIKSVIKFKELITSLKVFRKADYILDIGQGDSFSDIYGERRFNLINLVHREARLFDTTNSILPQTIGPFKDSGIKKKAYKAIKQANLVMTRDKKSYDYVTTHVPEQKAVKEYIDVAFFLPYKKMEFEKENIHVGLNISALLWHGGYTGDNQFGLITDYQLVVRQIIDYFLSQPNVKLHLVSHVVSAERMVENDYAVAFDLTKEYNSPNLVLAPFFLSPIDAKDYISGLDFFMGARMHATIAAFSSGVPVVPMAYSRKFNGLFVDTLGYEHIVDLKVDSESDSFDKVQDFYKHRQMLKSEIEKADSSIIRERKKALINDLKTFFQI
jgi:colanic acid/amylovoran biosynthesis protein